MNTTLRNSLVTVVFCLILLCIAATCPAASVVQGKITNIRGSEVTIVADAGKPIVVKANPQDLKIGDSVIVQNGKIARVKPGSTRAIGESIPRLPPPAPPVGPVGKSAK